MRDVAIVSFAQAPSMRRQHDYSDAQMLLPLVQQAVKDSGLQRSDLEFVCSGSADYLAGSSFSFIGALDAVGAWPPVSESHLEMDGAWALFEAWTMLQIGQASTALVFGFGRSSVGIPREVLTIMLDPYYLSPLGVDSVSLAALQTRALLESTDWTEKDMAEVASRSRRDAMNNEFAQVKHDRSPDDLLKEPYFVDPLRAHDCAPISDGAAVAVLVAGDRAKDLCERPAWIKGFDHRIEAHAPGVRDLTKSPSTRMAVEKAGGIDGVEVAELSASFTSQELILRDALGIPKGSNGVAISPSGGALAANPIMATGLIRIGEAANQIMNNGKRRALAHATSGHCLQQNLVCILEGD